MGQAEKEHKISWDLVVRGQEKKWKSGKDMKYKVTLKGSTIEGTEIQLSITSHNPNLPKIYPQDERFTVTLKDCDQQLLPEKKGEDEEE